MKTFYVLEITLKEIISKQSLMKAQLRQIADDVNSILVLQKNNGETEVTNRDSIFKDSKLPLNKRADLENIELLLGDENNFRCVVSVFLFI